MWLLLEPAEVARATRGVDALYWVDPTPSGPDPLADYVRAAESVTEAVVDNQVGRVVFQSSVGAEKRHGVGEIDGLAATEEALDATDASVTHLRCGYFFSNLELQIEALRSGAEVLGGAIALHLLFGTDLFVGGLITAVVAFGLLGLQTRGARPFEVAITGLLLVVLIGFLINLVAGGIDASAAVAGLTPQFAGTDTVLLAAGMLGATVMPHVIYLHGALTQARFRRSTEEERLALLRHQRVDVVVAMTVAGVINLSMLVVAAQVLAGGSEPVETIEQAHAGLGVALGPTAALLFALALLASGFAASGVGTLSGQVIMQGFLRRRIPLAVRRLVTLLPALVVIGVGVDPTRALVISQVVLSFGIPFALIPLVIFTSRRAIMGALVNRTATTIVAVLVAGVICLLNATLIWLTFSG